MTVQPTASLSNPDVRRAVIASVIGNGLEWFDFLSYAYFASFIAQTFFPVGDRTASLLLTFGVFAAGFIVRPIGGVLLGLYADKHGRKRALTVLIGMMALGTLLVGLTPGYATIGVLAPALVILARIIQGLSVGGEFGTAAAMLTEYAPPDRRMLYGSFQMASQGVALLLASGFGYVLTTTLSPESMQGWGWRIPFLFGALVGPVGVYIRHHVGESPEFQALHVASGPATRSRAPLSMSALLCAIGVIAVGTALNYLWHSYAPTFVTRELHLSRHTALGVTTVAGIVAIIGYPISGWIADRVGAFRLFFPAVIGFALAAWPLYHYVVIEPSMHRLLVAELIATLFLCLMSGPHPGMLSALFPTAVRTTGIAISYNLAVTVFGGLAPVTVTWLISRTNDPMMPAYYQIGAAILSVLLVAATASAWRATTVSARPLARRRSEAAAIDR